MSDWRDNVGEDLPHFGLGGLEEGDELVVQFLDEGEEREAQKEEWDNPIAFQVAVMSAPEDYMAKDDGEEVTLEEGEDYYLLSSSSRFLRQIMSFANTLNGQIAVIEGWGENYNRQYKVTSAAEGDK